MISKEFYSYDLAHKMNDNSDTSKLCNLLMQNIEFCKINLNNQIIESRGNHKVKFNAIVGMNLIKKVTEVLVQVQNLFIQIL